MNSTSREHPHYNPDTLLDTVKEWLGISTDRALAEQLRVGPPVISKIRHRRYTVSSELLLRIHELTSLPIRDLRFLAGDFRLHTGVSTVWIAPVAVTYHLSAPAQACVYAAFKRRAGAKQ